MEPFPLVCGSSDNPIDVQLVDVVEEAQLKGQFFSAAHFLPRPHKNSPLKRNEKTSFLDAFTHQMRCFVLPSVRP